VRPQDGVELGPDLGSAVRVPKAAELIAQRLRRRIIRKELVAGQLLPTEAALMNEFGVSRPTLREAMRILESEALIAVRRGDRNGARVQPPDGNVAASYAGLVLQYRGATAEHVFAARLVIEPACAALLAANRTPETVAALREALPVGDLNPAEDHRTIREVVADATVFHAAVVELAGNPALTLMSEMIRHIIARGTVERLSVEPSASRVPERMPEGRRAHTKVIDLIEAGDAEGAERLWRRHLEESDHLLFGPAASKRRLDLLARDRDD